jgi:hypothetical protein
LRKNHLNVLKVPDDDSPEVDPDADTDVEDMDGDANQNQGNLFSETLKQYKNI